MSLFNRKPIQPTQPILTEEVIRRIVREELLKLLQSDEAVEKELVKTMNDNDYIRKENLVDELMGDDDMATWISGEVEKAIDDHDFDGDVDEALENVEFTVSIEHSRR